METTSQVLGRVLLALSLLPLVACASVEEVRLQHPDTGAVAVCKGKSGLNSRKYPTAVNEQRGCIQDYKEQGYTRI